MNVSSKLIFILAIGFIFSSGAQAQIYFHKDLPFDPLNSDIKDLKVKKIEVYSTKWDDSLKIELDYVVFYDSLYRMSSLFFVDLYSDETHFSQLDQEYQDIFNKNDSTHLYYFISNDSVKKLIFNRLDYIYDSPFSDEFSEIKLSGGGGISSGIYLKGYNGTHSITNVYENNLLVKKEYKSKRENEDETISTEYYVYEVFKTDKKEIKLLSKTTYNLNSKRGTYIKYYF